MSDEGRVLAGRYRVGALIGRGGMADVHVGTDTRLGRHVAIKLLKPQLANDPAFRMRFRQEAQSAARMAHPTIVRVFDAGEETVVDASGQEVQLPFIVMEYVEGRLLKDIIHDGPLEPAAAVRVIDGVLTALEYSHRAGVVHRDIKPGNIMITTTGQVKVMDFGIARAVSDSSTTVAQTTAILGTASYFSPEQAKGETVDARTDLYSTGVVLFEMLTGRPPFRGDTPVAVAYQHVSERPVKPSVINPKVSPALDAVVLHALAKNRDERYQTAAEFRADVDTAASGRVPVHRQPDEAHDALRGAHRLALELGARAAPARRRRDDDAHAAPPAGDLDLVGHHRRRRDRDRRHVLGVQPAAPRRPAVERPRDPGAHRHAPTKRRSQQLQELGLPATRIDETERHRAGRPGHRHRPSRRRGRRHGTAVTVYVSTGREAVAVPDVRNKTLEQAKADAHAAGLCPAPRPARTHRRARRHRARHDARGRGAAEVGSTVDFRISSGMVTLTDVTGQTLSAASSYLGGREPAADAGAEARCLVPGRNRVRRSPSSRCAPGDVPQDSEVELTYCAG